GLAFADPGFGAGEGVRVVLVLDDFDAVHDPATLRRLLQLATTSPGFQLVVCYRRRHPIEAMATRSMEAQTIRPDDLALDPAEVVELARVIGNPLTAEEAETLQPAFGGWIAPTRLVIEASAGGTLPLRAADDYLQVAALQTFADHQLPEQLMRFALTEPIGRALFRDLSDVAEPDRAFNGLEATGLARRRYGEGEPGLAPPALTLPPAIRAAVGDLYTERHPQEAPGFHRRLARWYLGHAQPGNEVAAIRHAVLGDDWETAEAIWFRHGTSLMMQPAGTFGELLESIPGEVLEGYPSVAIFRRAMSIAGDDSDLDGRMATVRSYYEASSQVLATLDDPRLIDLIVLGTGHLIGLRLNGRFDDSEQFAEELSARIDGQIEAGEARPDLLRWFYLQWGLTRTLLGDRRGAMLCYRRCWEYRTTSKSDWVSSNAAANLALTHALSGDTERARLWLDRDREFDTSHLWGDYLVGLGARIAEGMLALDRLDPAGVEPQLQHLGDGSIPVELWAFVAFLRAQYELHFGNPFTALTTLDAAEQSQDDRLSDKGAAARLLARARADLLIATGDHRRAGQVLEAGGGDHPLLAVPTTRIHLLTGDEPEAQRIADQALARTDVTTRDRLELLLLQAAAAFRTGDHQSASQNIRNALSIYQKTGILRPFATLKAGVREWLMATAGDGMGAADWATVTGQRPVYPNEILEVRLSRQEQAVLASLQLHASRQDIADQLYVSVNTVKTHLNSVYRKLGTSSRDQALIKARQLGLLP
ncbi:MAG TPA: LuxR C-terminal-related transcriptional regulator, partial [Acidimicrobiales bacterium]|nr:LuxR C-terminal-related transcriptional regulator [Acidimicrobiales bacterium]